MAAEPVVLRLPRVRGMPNLFFFWRLSMRYSLLYERGELVSKAPMKIYAAEKDWCAEQ